jgi:hypothetical protein
MITPTQREDVRIALLGFLAARFPLAFEASAIGTIMRRRGPQFDFPLEDADILAACEFLLSAGFVQAVPGPLGASRHFSATAAGILEAERKGYK